MSKRRKGRRYKRQMRQLGGQNRHHLIYQGRHFSSGYGKMLRAAFVYPLDINIHNELHNSILHDIPRPSNAEIKAMWIAYQESQETIAALNIVDACEWLMLACEDSAWRACMERQWRFLKNKLH